MRRKELSDLYFEDYIFALNSNYNGFKRRENKCWYDFNIELIDLSKRF